MGGGQSPGVVGEDMRESGLATKLGIGRDWRAWSKGRRRRGHGMVGNVAGFAWNVSSVVRYKASSAFKAMVLSLSWN
jgi:hypothetical protein